MKTPKKLLFWWRLLIMAVLGYFIMRGLLGWIDLSVPSGVYRPILIPGLLLLLVGAYYGSVLWHELGHLLVGLSQRFRLVYFIVGPIMLYHDAGSWGLRRNTFNQLGGFTAMGFPSDRPLLRSFRRYVAGGPATSLLGLLLVLYVWYGTGVQGWGTQEVSAFRWWFALFLMLFGFFNGMMALVSLVPQQRGVVQTDGARLLQLFRAGPRREAELDFLQIYQASLSGVRPRELEEERLYALLDNEVLHPYGPFVRLYLYYKRMDEGRTEEAGPLIRRGADAVALEPDLIRQTFTLEEAFYHTMHPQSEGARMPEWPERVNGLIEAGTRARYAMVRAGQVQDTDEVDRQRGLALQHLPHQLDRGLSTWEADWVRTYREPSTNPIM